MKVYIKNLGAINKAEIDLNKKLTVFCGPNGTGKTYLSYIIFALARLKIIDSESVLETEELNRLISGETIEIPLDFDTMLKYRNARISFVCKDVQRIFGISMTEAKHLFARLDITDNEKPEDFEKRLTLLEYDAALPIDDYTFDLNKHSGSTYVSLKISCPFHDDENYKSLLKSQLKSIVYNQLILFPLTNCYFFPVERSAINTFAKEIYIHRGTLIDKIRGAEINDASKIISEQTNQYPLAISDCIRIANNLTNLSTRNGIYSDLAEEIEEELMHGMLKLNKNGELEFVSNYAKSKVMPIKVASSMVKTLASLIFYIRHIAQKYDLIIIDEPELNLHPDAQIVFVRLMAKMIQHGLRFLISTHSDYIIREINHLILLNKHTDEMMEAGRKIGYDEDMFLSSEDVAAYIFKPSEKTGRVSVKQEDVGNDGFSIETFDEAINKLNINSENLFEAYDENNDDF